MPSNMAAEELAKYIDLDAGLGRVRGNKSLYKRMLGLFQQSEEFSAFEQALEAQDITRAGDLAHGIKGMSGNLGLDCVFELSNQIMVEFRDNQVRQELIEEYREALKLTLEAVDEVVGQLA